MSLYRVTVSSKMADELDRSFLEELDREKLLKMGDCEYKRSLYLLPTLNKFRRKEKVGFATLSWRQKAGISPFIAVFSRQTVVFFTLC